MAANAPKCVASGLQMSVKEAERIFLDGLFYASKAQKRRLLSFPSQSRCELPRDSAAAAAASAGPAPAAASAYITAALCSPLAAARF